MMQCGLYKNRIVIYFENYISDIEEYEFYLSPLNLFTAYNYLDNNVRIFTFHTYTKNNNNNFCSVDPTANYAIDVRELYYASTSGTISQ